MKIKRITKDTDIASLKMKEIKWDVVTLSQPYQVVSIQGYVHTISYQYGREIANSLWAYPLGKTPTYENLVEYTLTEPVAWGISFKPHVYLRPNSTFKGDDFDSGQELAMENLCRITRNGEVFGDTYRTIEEAQVAIEQFKNHPIPFECRNYEDEIINRKVWYRSEPGIITKWMQDRACVVIEPDGIETFSVPLEFENDPGISPAYKPEHNVVVSVLDNHIWWYRYPEE